MGNEYYSRTCRSKNEHRKLWWRKWMHRTRLNKSFRNPSRKLKSELIDESYDDFGDAVIIWGMNMEYYARIWDLPGDFGLMRPVLWLYLVLGFHDRNLDLEKYTMDGPEITCKISHNMWKDYGQFLEDCGWFGGLQISHLLEKLTKSSRASWFFQDLSSKQNIRTKGCVKIHEHLSDQFYSIWFKSCLTWHHLVVNFLVHIFWWGKYGIFSPMPFAFSPPPDPSAVCRNAFRLKSQQWKTNRFLFTL